MISRKKFLVYQYDVKENKHNLSPKLKYDEVEWTIAQPESIKRFFSTESCRLKTFMEFYKKGFLGVILHLKEEYVTYAWMSIPGCPEPFHLPRWVRDLNSYWIFYCRTNEKFAQQGFFKLALRLLIRLAYDKEPEPTVYIETDLENLPSQRGTLSAGFKPKGTLTCYYLKLPRLIKPIIADWDRSDGHPDVAGKVQSDESKGPPSNFGAKSPLLHEGWQEFNRIKWGVEVIRARYTTGSPDLPTLDVCFYLDKRGRICLPPRNPYHGLVFTPKPTDDAYRLNRQWTEVAEQLLDEMRARGIAHSFIMPPEITDMRQWQWAGFRVGIKYTYYADFPFNVDEAVQSSVRRKINKALKLGYRCERTDNFTQVIDCMAETEARQGFDHQLSVNDLELARELMGDDCLRTYICYAPDGEAASTQIWLYSPGARAIGWVSGGKIKHLSSGANQFVHKFSLENLQEIGASGIDDAGANIPNVAAAKEKFGFRLEPYYYIEPCSFKQAARSVIDWWKLFRSDRRR